MSDILSGLFGGGGGGGGFNLLDPLGLGKMVEGLVGGLFKGDTGGVGSTGQSAIGSLAGMGQSQNHVGGFDPTEQSAADGASDPAADPATTEVPPPADPDRASCGYASTAAADPEELKALTTAMAQFSEFDFQGCPWPGVKDGLFDRGNLQAIVGDSYFDAYPDIKKAAQYLLDHPEVMNKLTLESGRSDGCVSVDGLKRLSTELTHSQAQTAGQYPPPAPQSGPVPPAPTQSSGPGTDAIAGQNDGRSYGTEAASSARQMIALVQGQATQGVSASDSWASTSSGSSSPGGGAMGNMSTLQGKVDSLTAKMHSQGLTKEESLDMQQLTEKLQEMFSLMSNISKMHHEMSMTAINNIR